MTVQGLIVETIDAEEAGKNSPHSKKHFLRSAFLLPLRPRGNVALNVREYCVEFLTDIRYLEKMSGGAVRRI